MQLYSFVWPHPGPVSDPSHVKLNQLVQLMTPLPPLSSYQFSAMRVFIIISYFTLIKADIEINDVKTWDIMGFPFSKVELAEDVEVAEVVVEQAEEVEVAAVVVEAENVEVADVAEEVNGVEVADGVEVTEVVEVEVVGDGDGDEEYDEAEVVGFPVVEGDEDIRCIGKVMMVEETEWEEVVKCDHSYSQRCHQSFVTR